MVVTDRQVAAMRAHLSARSEAEAAEAERLFIVLARTGHASGISELLYAAFTIAARWKFAPSWESGDIIRFVADVRGSSGEAYGILNPAVAENQLRAAPRPGASWWLPGRRSNGPRAADPAGSARHPPRSDRPGTRQAAVRRSRAGRPSDQNRWPGVRSTAHVPAARPRRVCGGARRRRGHISVGRQISGSVRELVQVRAGRLFPAEVGAQKIAGPRPASVEEPESGIPGLLWLAVGALVCKDPAHRCLYGVSVANPSPTPRA